MDDLLITLLRLLFSDTAVMLIILSPLCLLMLNFVFGSCIVSEAVTRAQDGPAQANHSRHRRVGRACVCGVLMSFAWQYAGYYYLTQRISSSPGREGSSGLFGKGEYQCSPLHFLFDSLAFLLFKDEPSVASRWRSAISCQWRDFVFLMLLFRFFYLYLKVVLSSPVTKKATKSSSYYCRRCDAVIAGMDHHCYLVCNCIGSRNRAAFMELLVMGVAELAFLLYCCVPRLLVRPSEVGWFLTSGLVVAGGALLCLSALTLLHIYLWWNALTTKLLLSRIKTRRREQRGKLKNSLKVGE